MERLPAAPGSVFRGTEERTRVLAGALTWLAGHASLFDPPQEDEVFTAAPEHIVPGRSRKAFGELGLALRLAHRVPALREREDIQSLTKAWLAMARRRNIFFDARRRVHLVPLMAVALAVMNDIDTAPDPARRALQAVLDRRFLDRTERSAWSQVDIRYYFDALGLRHGFPAPDTLLRRSTLLTLPALPYAQRIDLYAITHLVFHLSDFGARPLPGLARPDLAEIRDYLALALAMCVAERDWDLVGELLAARACVGGGADPVSHFAADALLEAQQPAGFIPDQSWLRGLDTTEERETAEFFAVYHPTLVAVIAVACDMAKAGPGPGAGA
ncbi:MAG TPA: hypothetical protein VHG08_10930 [Longimicrobium sp.]|nr:hypothetical protein [Longimicrobium sp.]